MPQHRHDGRPRCEHLRFVFLLLDGDFFAGFFDDRVEAEFFCDSDRNVARNVLIDRRHGAHLDELADHVFGRHDHRSRELLHGEQVGDFDRLELRRRRRSNGLGPFLASALFLEQHLFLAIFLAELFLVHAHAIAGAAARTRRRAFSNGRNSRTERTRRRERAERSVALRTARRRGRDQTAGLRHARRGRSRCGCGRRRRGTHGTVTGARSHGLNGGTARCRHRFQCGDWFGGCSRLFDFSLRGRGRFSFGGAFGRGGFGWSCSFGGGRRLR